MPFPNEHAARVRQPGLFARIVQLQKLPNGIRILGGPLKSNPQGSGKTQAYRFPKSKFTAVQARKWLKDHKIKVILFEPASASQSRYIEDDNKIYEIAQKPTQYIKEGGRYYQINDDGTMEEVDENLLTLSDLASLDDMMVFKTGEHNGHKYTDDDLDEIAANFKALTNIIRPKLKITHKESQDTLAGLASYGDVISAVIRDVKDKAGKMIKHLFVRVTSVPKVVAEWINDRRFPERSVEIWPKIKVNGKWYKNVLRNVSMLGHEPPAVTGLEPIRAAGDDFEFQTVTLALEGDEEAVIVVFEEAQLKGGDIEMPETKVDVTEEVSKMQAAIGQLKADVEAKDGEIAKMKGEKDSERLLAEKKDLVEKLADAEKQVVKLQDLEKEAKEGKAAKDELKKLKDDTRKSTIDDAIKSLKDDKNILPKDEPRARALMGLLGDEVVKLQIPDGEDESKTSEVEESPIQMLTALLQAHEHDAFKEVSTPKGGGSDSTDTGSSKELGEQKAVKFDSGERSGTTLETEGNELDVKARKFMETHKDASYEEALIAVSS